MDYKIEISVDGDEDMVEINIRQGKEDWLCYGGSSRKDLVNNVAGALEEFLQELETGEIPE